MTALPQPQALPGLPLAKTSVGELAIGDQFEKHSYPLGILVNAEGRRFVDEGADFHSFTYAKYGRAVLEQPGQFAWQVFDAKVLHLLRPEYGIQRVTKVRPGQLRGRDGIEPKTVGS